MFLKSCCPVGLLKGYSFFGVYSKTYQCTDIFLFYFKYGYRLFYELLDFEVQKTLYCNSAGTIYIPAKSALFSLILLGI